MAAPAKTYNAPPNVDLSKVVNLMPEHALNTALQPHTPVICINRGPKLLKDKHDANDYEIPPFATFQVRYDTAQHFQRRLIVAGTRNPNPSDTSMPQFVSWIAILGVDPPAECEPFTDAELERFGESTEGLNRDAFDLPGDRDIDIRATAELRRSLPGGGGASHLTQVHKPQAGLNQEVIGGAAAIEDALAPVVNSDARMADAADPFEKPDESQLSVRSAPTPTQSDPAGTGRRGTPAGGGARARSGGGRTRS